MIDLKLKFYQRYNVILFEIKLNMSKIEHEHVAFRGHT